MYDRREFGGQLSAHTQPRVRSMRLFPGACRTGRKEKNSPGVAGVCGLVRTRRKCGSVLKACSNELKLVHKDGYVPCRDLEAPARRRLENT